MGIRLGDKGRDTTTGFEGICIAITDYISGCRRVQLQPPVGADGKIPEAGHFDEPMVEISSAAAVMPKISTDGGPRPAPVGHAAPRR